MVKWLTSSPNGGPPTLPHENTTLVTTWQVWIRVNSLVVVRMPPLKRFTLFGGIYVEYPTVFGEIYVKYIWSKNCLVYSLTLPVVTMITRISSMFPGNLGTSKAECSTWQKLPAATPFLREGRNQSLWLYCNIIYIYSSLSYESHHAVGTLPDVRPWKPLENYEFSNS